MFLLLTVGSLTLGPSHGRRRSPLAIALISLSTFIGGGFQMLALKVGSYAFPREQAAMMSGIASGAWSLVNFVLLRAIGDVVGMDERRPLGGNLLADRRAAGDRHRHLAGAQQARDDGPSAARRLTKRSSSLNGSIFGSMSSE